MNLSECQLGNGSERQVVKGNTVVEYLTQNPKIEGSNSASVTNIEKIKKVLVKSS
jgi:hypothetical protein